MLKQESKKSKSKSTLKANSMSKHKVLEQKEELEKKGSQIPMSRDDHIGYTLDMLVDGLVKQGHINSGQSYLLKTPEMKEHIGRMCDNLKARREKEEIAKKNSRRMTMIKPASLPITIITNGPVPRKNVVKKEPEKETPVPALTHLVSTATTAVAQAAKKRLELRRSSVQQPSKSKSRRSTEEGIQEMVGKWKLPQRPVPPTFIVEESTMSGNYTDIDMSPKTTLSGRIRNGSKSIMAKATAFQTKIDLEGFRNDEISLDMDGRKLIVVAVRTKREDSNARKVTEIIEIPEGVRMESLKIGRRNDGSLVIEEDVQDDWAY